MFQRSLGFIHHWFFCFIFKKHKQIKSPNIISNIYFKIMQIMNIESIFFLLFTIAAEIPVTATSAEYLLSSVSSLCEGPSSTNNRETISGFNKISNCCWMHWCFNNMFSFYFMSAYKHLHIIRPIRSLAICTNILYTGTMFLNPKMIYHFTMFTS